MRLLMIVLGLMLIGTAMAESAKVGSYNVTFNMSQPHEIVQQDENTTSIKTFNGSVTLAMFGREPKATPSYAMENLLPVLFPSDVKYQLRDVLVDGKKSTIAIVIQDDLAYMVLIPASDTNFIWVIDDLGLFETADFLRSLHIKKEN